MDLSDSIFVEEVDRRNMHWSPEAESGLLGSILLDNENWDRVADILVAEHFHSSINATIFDGIGRLVNSGKTADVLTVYDHLQSTNKLGAITLPDIHALTLNAGTSYTIRQYAVLVAERAMSRKLLAAAGEVQAIAFDVGAPVMQRIDLAQSKLSSLQDSTITTGPKPIQDYIVDALDRVSALADGSMEPGIPTGIPGLDRLMGGGLRGGKQIVLAARPSVGKSSIAEQVCINLAKRGYASAMFSMEMSNQEMSDRAICNLGRIDMGRYLTGKLEDDEWGRLADAVEEMRDLPLYLDEKPALTLQEISTRARILKRKHDIKLLVIDYIQLCGVTNPKLSRHHQLEELSRGLKSLAKTLSIDIVTLSQLNREVEKRTGGRPIMADLKESGAIEEDADVVMLMWRAQVNDDHNIIGIDIPKNRGGRTGELAMRFEGRFQRWGESSDGIPMEEKKSSSKFAKEL